MTETHTGGCLCGAVRYRVAGPMRPVIACHCRQCRRQSGHYYAASGAAPGDVEIEGAVEITWYEASAHAARGFCSHCGSALFWHWHGRDHLSILAGSLDEPSGLRLIGHIFVGEKGDYYEIADGLPQRERGTDGEPVSDLTGGGGTGT